MKIVAPPPSRRQYPWEEWKTGTWFEMEQGIDFDCQLMSFVVYARQRGFSVRRFMDKVYICWEKPGS
jgi:hypothetical protein